MATVFSKNLTRFRYAAGVSQKEAAAALQVSQALLSHYEKGIRQPGLHFISRAADYYGQSVDALLGRAPDQARMTQCPSPAGQELRRELQNSMELLMDLLSVYYEPEVYYYASLYLGDSIYELLRHFARLTDTYDPAFYHLPESRFQAGALNSDLTLARENYFMALNRYRRRVGALQGCSEEDLEARYGHLYDSMRTLVERIGTRMSEGTPFPVTPNTPFEETELGKKYLAKKEETP